MGMKILQEERDIYYSAPEEIAWARADMMNALGRRLMEMLADLPEGKDARVMVDKENPRTEIFIEELEDEADDN